MLLQKQDILIL